MSSLRPFPRIAALMLCAAFALLLGACGGSSAGPRGTAIVREVTFAPGEELVYALHDDTGAVVGHGKLTVTARDDGRLELAQQYNEAQVPAGSTPTSDRSTVLVDAKSLQPRESQRIVQQRDGESRYVSDYAEDGKTLQITSEHAGKVEKHNLQLNGPLYDNESSLWLWRTLALDEHYQQRYVSLNIADRSRQTVSLAVTGREHVDVPAGGFDTWRLQVRNGRATRVAWVNVQAPHQVVQWDNGSTVFKLESAH